MKHLYFRSLVLCFALAATGISQTGRNAHSQSMNFSKATSLQSPSGDMFPLSVHNTWTYSYEYNYSNAMEFEQDSGITVFTIIDSFRYSDTTDWTFREHRLIHHSEHNPRYSLSFDVDTTIDRKMREFNAGNHLISFFDPYSYLGMDLTGYISSNLPESSKIYRYQSIDSTGKASIDYSGPYNFPSEGISNYGSILVFKKDTGIVSAKIQGSDGEYWDGSLELRLIGIPIVNGVAEEHLPLQYSLMQNYPNPFNPTTTINFSLGKSMVVTLRIYNVLGQSIATLMNETKPPGNYTTTWNSGNNPTGVYFYVLNAGNNIETRKMLLIR